MIIPARNSLSERSFSALQQRKTWIWNTMGQMQLNWSTLLHVRIHNDETNALDFKAKLLTNLLLVILAYKNTFGSLTYYFYAFGVTFFSVY